MRADTCFPCQESPRRCFLSSKGHDKRISCSPEGNIFVSENRQAWEEWYILETSDGMVRLKSCAHGKYLLLDSCGYTSTCDNAFEEQCLLKFEKVSAGLSSYTITSHNAYDKYLCCRRNGDVSGLKDADMCPSDQKEWDIEILSGELCFISSPTQDKRLSCHPWNGKLSLSSNWKGWEVWRFIEAGDGHVRISNWTHTNNFLCSDSNGNVWTTDFHRGDWQLWDVERTPNGSDGVVLKSVSHGRFLKAGSEDSPIGTSDIFNGDCNTWQTDAGNSHEFYLTSVHCDKRIGSSTDIVYGTQNRKGWEVWVMEKESNGLISLRSKDHGKRLGSDSKGNVYVTDEANESEFWKLEMLCEDGICIKSAKHDRFLSCSENDCISAIESAHNPSVTWFLEPCLPATITGNKMRNLAIGGSIAIASMVATPFAVMGIVAGLGFGTGGIAAGSAGAAMMSAEAVASGGMIAVGGTVATLQSIGAAGLGIAGTSAAVGAGAVVGASAIGISATVPSGGPSSSVEKSVVIRPFDHRPICNWRSW